MIIVFRQQQKSVFSTSSCIFVDLSKEPWHKLKLLYYFLFPVIIHIIITMYIYTNRYVCQ